MSVSIGKIVSDVAAANVQNARIWLALPKRKGSSRLYLDLCEMISLSHLLLLSVKIVDPTLKCKGFELP